MIHIDQFIKMIKSGEVPKGGKWSRMSAQERNRKRSTRLTPEAYTRLMLRAKEGEISPTRIEQVLGKLGSRPLRRLS